MVPLQPVLYIDWIDPGDAGIPFFMRADLNSIDDEERVPKDGSADRGMQLLREVVARAPQNVAFQVHLASALAGSDLEDDARIMLQPLLDVGVQLAEISEASALVERLGVKP